jgi:type I restriction enzyme, S subunit
MSQLHPYPSYKNTDLSWLPKIPKHWEVMQLKRIASLKSGESITNENIEEVGQYPVYGGNGLRGYTKDYSHNGHFVLIGRQGALCGNVNYAHGKFWASEHAVVVSPIKPVDTIWLGELLRAMNLNQYSISAAQPGLAVDRIRQLNIPIPPLSEQQDIAAYLDRQTAKIDALITRKERLLELLAEKRAALISQAVTKGLKKDKTLKKTSVVYLGEIPSSWDFLRAGNIARIVRGQTPRPAGDPKLFHGDFIPWIPVAEVTKDNEKYLTEAQTMLTEEGMKHSRVFEKGTFVLSNSGATLGVPKILGIKGCMNDGSAAFLNISESIDKDYLYYYFLSTTDYLRGFAAGMGQPNLNTTIISNLFVPRPPLHEQKEIAGYLDHQTKRLSDLATKIETAIARLQEYRAALISSVVTGKVKII